MYKGYTRSFVLRSPVKAHKVSTGQLGVGDIAKITDEDYKGIVVMRTNKGCVQLTGVNKGETLVCNWNCEPLSEGETLELV